MATCDVSVVCLILGMVITYSYLHVSRQTVASCVVVTCHGRRLPVLGFLYFTWVTLFGSNPRLQNGP